MNPTYGTINTTVESIIRALTAAGNGVDATLQPVFFIGGVLMLVFACMKFMWSKDLAPIAAFVIQFCMLMGIVTLSSGWMSITESYVGAMGTYGASIGGFVVDQLNPASVMIRGLSLADKMYTENISWMRTIFGTTEDTVANLLMLIVCLGTILVAALMAVFLPQFYLPPTGRMGFGVAFAVAAVVLAVAALRDGRGRPPTRNVGPTQGPGEAQSPSVLRPRETTLRSGVKTTSGSLPS